MNTIDKSNVNEALRPELTEVRLKFNLIAEPFETPKPITSPEK